MNHIILITIFFTSQISKIILKRYHDFGLDPGTTYSYNVIGYNKAGHVQSEYAMEITDPAAPAGLQPPQLSPVSSTSIHVVWYAPANPNGIIVNFTLYTREVGQKLSDKVSDNFDIFYFIIVVKKQS